MENQDYEFKIGDIVIVDELQYQYKQYDFLESGMIGTVVDVLPTNNRHDWQRLEIILVDRPLENVRLYSVEVKFLNVSIGDIKIDENIKEKCEMIVNKNNNVLSAGIQTAKLMECFENKVTEKIENYFNDLESNIIDNDPIQSVMEIANKYTQDCLEEKGIDSVVEVSVHIDNDCGDGNIQSLTKESVEELDFLSEQHNKTLENLEKFIKEINSVLCMCDSFEQSVQVLRDYGIIEKKKVKVISDFDFKVFCESIV